MKFALAGNARHKFQIRPAPATTTVRSIPIATRVIDAFHSFPMMLEQIPQHPTVGANQMAQPATTTMAVAKMELSMGE